MKIILKQEVHNLGLAGDVVDVADGYGRNFLLPRGMAIMATKGAMKEAEALTRARKAAEAQTLDQAVEYRSVLEGRVLRVPARVDERGHLYGSVGVNDVAQVLKERGHDIDKRRIDLSRTIKEIGTYEVPVQVHPQVTATVTLDVVDVEGNVVAGQIGDVEAPPLPGEGELQGSLPDGMDMEGDDELARLEAEALAAAEELDRATAESDEASPAATAESDEADTTPDDDAAGSDDEVSGSDDEVSETSDEGSA